MRFSLFFDYPAALLVLVMVVCLVPSHVPAAGKCKEVRQTEVEGREFLQPNAKYTELKAGILKQCMIDAVKQTLGTEVRHRASSSTTLKDDQASDKFSELSYEKARGSVLSYKVAKEDIQKMGEMSVLVIKVSADICVPDASDLQSIVKVGSFKMPGGQENPSMCSVMEAAFPANKKFILMPASKEDIPYDILLTGVVVSFKSVVEKSAAHAITRVLGDMAKGDGRRTTTTTSRGRRTTTTTSGSSGDEPNMFKSISENIDSQYQKVNAVITLTAKRVAEDETISKTVEVSKEINISTPPDAVLELTVKEGIEKAMVELVKRLTDEDKSRASQGGGFWSWGSETTTDQRGGTGSEVK